MPDLKAACEFAENELKYEFQGKLKVSTIQDVGKN